VGILISTNTAGNCFKLFLNKQYKNIKIYDNRSQAGRLLGENLIKFKKYKPVVISIPRGGVVLGKEISKILNSPHTVVIARKISHPEHPEYGIGAISEDLEAYFDFNYFDSESYDASLLTTQIIKERAEVKKRVKLFRGNKKLKIKNRLVIVVDDGLATGVTATSALRYLQKLSPQKIIFAAPVCAYRSLKDIKRYAQVVVCLQKPKNLRAISSYYKDFSQVSDELALNLLHDS